MLFRSSTKPRSQGISAGYIFKLTVGISLLMIVNSYVVGMIVQANLHYIPEFFHDIRLFQFCQVVIPFILVLLQFGIYDRIRDRMLNHQEPRLF